MGIYITHLHGRMGNVQMFFHIIIKNESNNILNPPNKSAENAINAYIKIR